MSWEVIKFRGILSVDLPMYLAFPPSITTVLVAAVIGSCGVNLMPGAFAEEPSPLVAELLRRTEQNRERNAAGVKRLTEQNAYTAYAGEENLRRLVMAPDGEAAFKPHSFMQIAPFRFLLDGASLTP
jgi:hypothetical protein